MPQHIKIFHTARTNVSVSFYPSYFNGNQICGLYFVTKSQINTWLTGPVTELYIMSNVLFPNILIQVRMLSSEPCSSVILAEAYCSADTNVQAQCCVTLPEAALWSKSVPTVATTHTHTQIQCSCISYSFSVQGKSYSSSWKMDLSNPTSWATPCGDIPRYYLKAMMLWGRPQGTIQKVLERYYSLNILTMQKIWKAWHPYTVQSIATIIWTEVGTGYANIEPTNFRDF